MTIYGVVLTSVIWGLFWYFKIRKTVTVKELMAQASRQAATFMFCGVAAVVYGLWGLVGTLIILFIIFILELKA